MRSANWKGKKKFNGLGTRQDKTRHEIEQVHARTLKRNAAGNNKKSCV